MATTLHAAVWALCLSVVVLVLGGLIMELTSTGTDVVVADRGGHGMDTTHATGYLPAVHGGTCCTHYNMGQLLIGSAGNVQKQEGGTGGVPRV